MTLHLRLLGAPTLEFDGTPVQLPRRKAMALLAYLASTRRCHQRDAVASLIWPESDSAKAHAALRNLLWVLRQTPLRSLLVSDRSIVQLLESDRLLVDVNLFRDSIRFCPSLEHGPERACEQCAPLLEAGVRQFTGPFMNGFSGADSGAFENWQAAEGEALRRALTETLERLVSYYFSIGDWDASSLAARRILESDPLSEPAYRSLMLALYQMGRRAEALKVFDECKSALKKDLRLKPEASTLKLAHSIRHLSAKGRCTEIRSSHLPALRFPPVGRKDIADRLKKRILDSSSRIISVIGPGGIGKSTLALHVAQQVEHSFSHGAAFVALDSRDDEGSVALAIGSALDIALGEVGDESSLIKLATSLDGRDVLIILDGAERIVQHVSALLKMFERANGLQFLITSRIELGIDGEIIVPLGGLAYPSGDTPVDLHSEYASVKLLRLLEERYGVASSVADEDAEGMARVTQLLEGSPLGLEMAAGWRSLLSWQDIADRIASSPDFLVHRKRDIAPKHRTMMAVFEGSWRLLPDDAQVALRRLSCFRGPFTLSAAEHVSKSEPTSFALLVNRSLLRRISDDRFQMHEVVRQQAAQKLAAEGRDLELTRERHQEYYANAVDGWRARFGDPEQKDALASMERELDNVLYAFQSAAEDGRSQLLGQLCRGIFSCFYLRSLTTEEGGVFLDAHRAYQHHENRSRDIEAFLGLAAACFCAWEKPALSETLMMDGMGLLSETPPDTWFHAKAYVLSAGIGVRENVARNRSQLSKALEYFRGQRDTREEALVLRAWARIEIRPDPSAALRLAKDALQLFREIGDEWGEGLVLHLLARLAELRAEPELALELFMAAHQKHQSFTGGGFGMISSLLAQARTSRLLNHIDTHREMAHQALHLSRARAYTFQTGRALVELAQGLIAEGDILSAKPLLEEAFEYFHHRYWSHFQAECARLLAGICCRNTACSGAERWMEEARRLAPDHPDLLTLTQRIARVGT